MVIDIQDDYYSRFVSLLEALPKGAVKAVETHKDSLSKEVLARVEEYKSGTSKTAPLDDKFWDEMDKHIDSLGK